MMMPLPKDDPRRRRPDISRAKALLGWSPCVPLEAGLKATIDWFAACASSMNGSDYRVSASGLGTNAGQNRPNLGRAVHVRRSFSGQTSQRAELERSVKA
jgi:hypothetical protein